MKEYHKIQTLFKRDMDNNGKIIEGSWTCPEFEYLKDNQWVFTEKVDGTNIRVMWDGKSVLLGGKTDKAQLHMDLVRALTDMFDTTPKRKLFSEIFEIDEKDENGIEVCLYGEGYGPGIQKGGGNYREDKSFVLFDVKVGDWWLQREAVEDIADKLGVGVVPIVGEGTLQEAVELTRKGMMSTWGNFFSEGIVARPKAELQTRGGNRIITKIKHVDFAE